MCREHYSNRGYRRPRKSIEAVTGVYQEEEMDGKTKEEEVVVKDGDEEQEREL